MITIDGVNLYHLSNISHQAIPDRIEAGLILQWLPGQGICINNVFMNTRRFLSQNLRKRVFMTASEDIFVEEQTNLKAVNIKETAPYPGFASGPSNTTFFVESQGRGTLTIPFMKTANHVFELAKNEAARKRTKTPLCLVVTVGGDR